MYKCYFSKPIDKILKHDLFSLYFCLVCFWALCCLQRPLRLLYLCVVLQSTTFAKMCTKNATFGKFFMMKCYFCKNLYEKCYFHEILHHEMLHWQIFWNFWNVAKCYFGAFLKCSNVAKCYFCQKWPKCKIALTMV